MDAGGEIITSMGISDSGDAVEEEQVRDEEVRDDVSLAESKMLCDQDGIGNITSKNGKSSYRQKYKRAWELDADLRGKQNRTVLRGG